MRAIQVSRTLRRGFAAAVSIAVLASCAQDTAPSTPDPPADAPTALVYGMTASPIYEALKSRVRMTVSNGSQKATDYDLIIFDGDSFGGGQLSSDELIREAVHSGVWVLGLDVVEEHKNGLGEMLHASSEGDVSAYLVRQAENADGRPGSRLIDFVNPDRKAEDVAQSVVDYITEQAVAPQQAGIPPRLLSYLVHHTSDYSGLMPGVTSPAFQPGECGNSPYYLPCPSSQTATWVVDHYITVLLDAGTSPFGDFQHVVVETAARADPGPLAINYIDSCAYTYVCEIAWIQTRFDASHTISAGSTPDKTLTLEKTSPTTTNKTDTVTTTSSFSVNFSKDQGVSGSYTYSKTDIKTITDWEVNDVSGNAAQWQYASNTVYDGMNTDSYDPGAWSNFYWNPRPPNNLSIKNLEYNVKSIWNSNAVSADTVNIGGTDSAWYTDAFEVNAPYYPPPDDAGSCRVFSCKCTEEFCGVRVYMARHNNKQPWGIAVNLAAVVPVPTKSLTFSPNPAVAGQTVTGTLTLSAPTPVPAQVLVSSDKPGITPEHDTYTIPANEDTLTFKVFTGDEGCEPESASIKTFYADGQNQSLSIKPASNCP